MNRKRIILTQQHLDHINEQNAQHKVNKAEEGGFLEGVGIVVVVFSLAGGVLISPNLGIGVFAGGLLIFISNLIKKFNGL